jgi:hypothetical protein
MMFAILIVQLELGRAFLLEFFLIVGELVFGATIRRAVIVRTFVDGFQRPDFPPEERGLAMRAPIFGLSAVAFADLEKFIADFTAQLRTLFTIVEIEIVSRRFTAWAGGGGDHRLLGPAVLNRRQRITVF